MPARKHDRLILWVSLGVKRHAYDFRVGKIAKRAAYSEIKDRIEDNKINGISYGTSLILAVRFFKSQGRSMTEMTTASQQTQPGKNAVKLPNRNAIFIFCCSLSCFFRVIKMKKVTIRKIINALLCDVAYF